MASMDSIIETGVDKLVKLVNEKKRVSMDEASKELGVSITVVEEWADFLEEEGIISIEYKLTKPFLIPRKITKKEVAKKAKEFSGKKEVFVRKAEGTLGFLEKESEKLKSLKGEFDKLRKDLGMEVETVKSDIAELEKYHHFKQVLDQQVHQQKLDSQKKINEMAKKIMIEQKKYQDLLSETKKEEIKLKNEKKMAVSMEESEQELKHRLNGLRNVIKEIEGMLGNIEKKIETEDVAIKNSEEHIEKLRNLSGSIKNSLESEKGSLEPIIQKSLEQKKKINELQSKIISKIKEKEDEFKNAKESSRKLKEFFNKKMHVVTLLDTVNKDKDILEKELMGLIKKARSFQLASKSGDVNKQMLELERKFKEVDKKKDIFEKEFKKLSVFLKKK